MVHFLQKTEIDDSVQRVSSIERLAGKDYRHQRTTGLRGNGKDSLKSVYASEPVRAESGEGMINFEDRSDGGMCITEGQIHIRLTFHEASCLWQWLSARQDVFHTHSSENPLEIPTDQEDLSHGEDVQVAIVDLHERELIDKVLDVRREITTEQALPLLKPFQIENHLHPFLEDDYTYAQG